MSINTLEMAKIFQTKLDEQVSVGATSAWMEANAKNVIYNGGDTVRMPEISTTGLAKYDRDKGFNQGSVTLKYRDYTMTQDRGRTFQLDSMDVNESNFIANAGTVLGTFQKEQVIPEIDSYRYSRIAALAKAEGRVLEDLPSMRLLSSKNWTKIFATFRTLQAKAPPLLSSCPRSPEEY